MTTLVTVPQLAQRQPALCVGGIRGWIFKEETNGLKDSKSFMNWLSYSYYTSTKNNGAEFGMSASESSIKQACYALNGIAEHEGRRLSQRLSANCPKE